MASMTKIVCKCGCNRSKMVRTADVKRGWGKYYNKQCKARHQSQTGKSSAYYASKAKFRHYQDTYGGTPVFDRDGNYEGFVMSPEDLAGAEDHK